MQRTKNLKCVVALTIILSLLITIGVAFFRGGSEVGNSIHHHGHEKPGAHHNEKADVHVHNNLETDNTESHTEELEHGEHRH